MIRRVKGVCPKGPIFSSDSRLFSGRRSRVNHNFISTSIRQGSYLNTTHFCMDTATNDEDEVTLIRHESGIFEIDPTATNKTQCLTTVVEELTSSVPLINSTEHTFVVIRSNILLPSNATKLVSTLFFEHFFHLVTVGSMILAELFQWAKRCTSSIFCAYPRGDSRNILVSCCMLLIMLDGLFACLPWD